MSQETLVSYDTPSCQIQRSCAHNVIIVGETGAGKSSAINLLAGKELAGVSSSASACTMEATSYDIELKDDQAATHHVRLFDTVGLNEPSLSKNDYFSAIEKANVLITQLQRTGGIRLLVFCIRGGRITSVMQNNYRLFRDILCQNQVPVAFVITGMENEHPMEGWWSRNAARFGEAGLSCTSHVCVTGTRGRLDVYKDQYEKSQTAVQRMLLDHMSRPSWKPERTGWFVHLAGMLWRWVAAIKHVRQGHTGSWNLTVDELSRRLEKRCSFGHQDAVDLARRIWAKRMESTEKIEGPAGAF